MSDKSPGSPLDYHNPTQHPRPKRGWSAVWSGLGGILVVALLISVLLPSLGKARETANRVKCQSNLRQLYLGAILYSNDHRGQLPTDLPTLYLHADFGDSSVFICASDSRDKAPGATPQQVVASLAKGDHLSYAWAATGMAANLQADMIIAFDLDRHLPKDKAPGKGINVLLGDGTTTFVNEADAKAIWTQFVAGVRPIRLPSSTATGWP